MRQLRRLERLVESSLLEGRSSSRTGITGRSPQSVLLLLANLSTAPDEYSTDAAAKAMFTKFKLGKKLKKMVASKARKERDLQAGLRAAQMGAYGGGYSGDGEAQQ
jgi:hypothetical protein